MSRDAPIVVQAATARAWADVEAPVGSLRGRKLYGPCCSP
jgi:hypothetical protein